MKKGLAVLSLALGLAPQVKAGTHAEPLASIIADAHRREVGSVLHPPTTVQALREDFADEGDNRVEAIEGGGKDSIKVARVGEITTNILKSSAQDKIKKSNDALHTGLQERLARDGIHIQMVLRESENKGGKGYWGAYIQNNNNIFKVDFSQAVVMKNLSDENYRMILEMLTKANQKCAGILDERQSSAIQASLTPPTKE